MQDACAAPRGRDDQAVDPHAQQQVDVARFLDPVFVGVAQDHGVAALLGRILDAALDQGPEGIGDVGKEGEKLRFIGAQGTGYRVGHVA